MAINLISKLLLFASLTLATATQSPGCGKPLPKAQQPAGGASHKVQFKQTNGTPRTYLIHIPKGYSSDKPAPLIFSFHGRGKTASSQEELSQFSNEKWNPDGIAVYPQGIENAWQGAPYSKGVDDIEFVTDMIDHITDRYCVNPKRIYAAGKSNGGGFTGTLACSALSSKIAAFAPVSAAFYIPLPKDTSVCEPEFIDIPCKPSRSVPILEFHGSQDDTIAYAGGARSGECLPSVARWVKAWSVRDGLGTCANETVLYGGKVRKWEYGGGKVTGYLTEGLGHAWPSLEANGDNPNGTYFDATPVIMEWFGRWSL
ncbi:alpha/beta-Hydrolase [Glarea lozoyensis ATCC 20868]|uniref:feruloyl esterase n=1 Tax=Glarea lozoyensis (strain ATCC 20868 / MF5171) TaxID=1116229 RepID=S3CC84_GLAL2|nr:alpha/beta-Hydrolase [Glarea lozoyensis ATCC 20868]EPE24177.1 alpha/beta-Hydrolase [Glarea lozoyensis ATCC 20868]